MTVSVIIPTYNCGHLISRAIESALAQTVPVSEIIVVDDGSTDDTKEKLRKFPAIVKYCYKQNGGVSSARNLGIKNAIHDWLAFLDADDYWLPTKIEKQLAHIGLDSNLILNCTSIQCIEEQEIRVQNVPSEDLLKSTLRFRNPITLSSVIVRRDAVLSAGGFNANLHYGEDWDLWLRLRDAGKFSVIPDPVTMYQISPGSLSTRTDRMLHDFEIILETNLLRDLHGLERITCKRRGWSAQLYSAAMACRLAGNHRMELIYLFRSILKWPFGSSRPLRALMYSLATSFSRPVTRL